MQNKSSILKSVFGFIKSEAVFVASWILALASMFFVRPDKKYLSYVDWKSLGILWSLMVIMNVFKQTGLFNLMARKLLSSAKKSFMLIGTLVFLCFFFSMAITNDVALITFVPFAIMILEGSPLLIPTLVLQTLAANLGSMITPIGNPQNLYLFSYGNFSTADFMGTVFPYWILSLFLLMISVFFVTRKSGGRIQLQIPKTESEIPILKTAISATLFALAVLSVLGFIPFYIPVFLVLIFSLIFQRQAFFKADYFLLLTFIGFFIFTGNMARIPSVNRVLKTLVAGRELFLGIAASQIISNVPAALLLSGFTNSISNLVLGVNLGGLGTLIASMASLISFKFYCRTKNSSPWKYLLWFTAANLIFLAALLALWFAISPK